MSLDIARLATEALEDGRSATPGPWAIDGDTDHRGEYRVDGITSPDGFVVICDSGVYPPDEPTARFIAAARLREPLLAAGVLDLTRQLAEARAENAELRSDPGFWGRTAARLTDENRQLRAARDEACDGWERCRESYYRGNTDSLGYVFAVRRIAELRAVGATP